jgi:hypothetical protein
LSAVPSSSSAEGGPRDSSSIFLFFAALPLLLVDFASFLGFFVGVLGELDGEAAEGPPFGLMSFAFIIRSNLLALNQWSAISDTYGLVWAGYRR